MAKNVKMLKLDKIEHFLLKNMQFEQNSEMYTDIVTYVFLSRPSQEKKL